MKQAFYPLVKTRIIKTNLTLPLLNPKPKQVYIILFVLDEYILLIQMGENPLIIKERLGHEDIETTLGTYGHLYPNSNFEVTTKLNGIISFNSPKENFDTGAKNQFTIQYLRNNSKKGQ